jgi:hypothetical protein
MRKPDAERRLFVVALLLTGSLAAASVSIGQVQWWGHFQRLMHKGDAGAKVQLADLPAGPGVYALGALAELRGEVMIWNGRVLVSRGERDDGGTERARGGDAAAVRALRTGRARRRRNERRRREASALDWRRWTYCGLATG